MIRINLAPAGRGLRRRSVGLQLPSFNLGLVVGAVCLIVVLAGGVYWWALSREATRLTEEIEAGNKELATLKMVLGPAAKAKEHLAELQKRVNAIQELTKGQERPTRMFDAFADALPRDLWITGFEEKATVLSVSGTAFSTTAIADLMANLARSGRFKEVDVVVARQDLTKSPRLVTFEVTCRFDI